MDFELNISKAADAQNIDHDVEWTNGKLLLVGQTTSGKVFMRLYEAPSDELAARRVLGRAAEEFKLLAAG